ncbi:ABC transporter ATP-binding protein [Deinococcus multiflagellatus]|uniref:ABC transporter ATP-binding protein n=1 Tax=Deinococcus multiflagellatus TaxID=1656887 RepID=A0ABW1ZLY0_9DEIO|nr:ABC transporter ATP-binding protein [Deinococcus multiflagellatus]MBZ9713441.1 ABC transporter ATP-binding protein [Deinococcus multiflagellatus]
MLTLHDVTYAYRLGQRDIPILSGCSWTFEAGSFTAICAPSGSGKSTLLNILGLLDRPTRGTYLLNGQDTSQLGDRAQSALRARTLGFLFQNFRLVPDLSVQANVALALEIAGWPARDRAARACDLLEQVGLAERLQHFPPELSGGEAQRVALARALAPRPQVLLADEPTGNLDPANRERILALLSAFHADGGTLVMVTHDAAAARAASHQVTLQGGQVQPLAQAPVAAPVAVGEALV